MQTIKSFKQCIIALVVSSNFFSQSNVYKPFPEGSAVWSMAKQSWSGLSHYKYKTSGDTLIGPLTYKKVLYSFSPNNPFNYGPFSFNFAYRNDSINKKVYYLDVTGGLNTEYLWYDFNLNLGDTVKSTYSYGRSYINEDRVVQSIDSVSICGKYHKRFKFNCPDDQSALVVGVGFMDNFIHSERHNDCPFEPLYLYSTGFSTCNITSVKDYTKDYQIILSPNPASSELKISNLMQIHSYKIFNTIGSVILQGELMESSIISLSTLLNGLYIIQLYDKSGNSYQSKFIKQ
ncbi:MAG: T9SS type A sorting domain-containing protein [Bacteroidota bacterium]|jgi:hypothetical protein